ncbi:unnamed protein product [Allacma fusca]|uniref:COX assembly mitochondrial protein n=1 Tax=Allacma fusca TaxID=39272 RepID=A0A8J2LEP2_9HEXA|nr:unnamed protein product [Allacma fusca]
MVNSTGPETSEGKTETFNPKNPHGVGDPNDKSLRKVEKDVCIPKIMRDKAKTTKCVAEVDAFTECCKNSNFFMVFKCKKQTNDMKECLTRWYQDDEFRKICEQEYLDERTEFRRTGIRKLQKEKQQAFLGVLLDVPQRVGINSTCIYFGIDNLRKREREREREGEKEEKRKKEENQMKLKLRRLGGSQANYLKAIIRNKSTVEKGFVEIRDGSVFSSLSQTRSSPYRISEEVYEAILKNSQPVVALESAIITHGMPYPHNIATALHLENIIRHKGVIPATVGVIEGQLTVGLSQQDIETLGSAVKEKCPGSSKSRVVKVSRRDLPYALSQGLSGGTTVSGTIIGAVGAKIPIFVTGGLGGVHRGAESTFDISADLKELGRSPIAVISAGVKSILDIGKTLEYLETEGVCVCVLDSEGKKARRREVRNENENDGEDIPAKNIRSIKFPSFFTSESPFPAPHVLDNEIEAANLLHSSFRLELGSGILIAVPIPKEFATSGERIEKAIETALEDARREGINGKDMTPFLLGKVNELTGGDSLEANKHLIENNALVGAEIALELLRLRKETVGEEMLSSSINSGDNSHSESHHLNSGHYHYVPGTGTRTGGGLRNCGLNNVGGVERNPTISSPTSTVRGFGTTTNCLTSHNGPTNCDHSLETDQPWHLEGFKGEDGNGRGPKSSRLNDETKTKSYHSFSSSGRPVVIGGTSLDLVLNVQEEAIVLKPGNS